MGLLAQLEELRVINMLSGDEGFLSPFQTPGNTLYTVYTPWHETHKYIDIYKLQFLAHSKNHILLPD